VRPGSSSKKYVEKVGEEGFKKAPVGAGPYKFVSFNPGVELVFEAFDQYWRKQPKVKRLVFKVIPDETTRSPPSSAAKWMSVYSNPRRARRGIAQQPRAHPEADARARGVPSRLSRPVGIRNRRGMTSGCGKRQVWRSTADDQRRPDPRLFGRSPAASSPTISNSFGNPRSPVYDPGKAKQLLAEAGFPNGFDAGEYYCDIAYANLGEAVLDNLLAIGIRAKLRPLERAAFFSGYGERSLRTSSSTPAARFGNTATAV